MILAQSHIAIADRSLHASTVLRSAIKEISQILREQLLIRAHLCCRRDNPPCALLSFILRVCLEHIASGILLRLSALTAHILLRSDIDKNRALRSSPVGRSRCALRCRYDVTEMVSPLTYRMTLVTYKRRRTAICVDRLSSSGAESVFPSCLKFTFDSPSIHPNYRGRAPVGTSNHLAASLSVSFFLMLVSSICADFQRTHPSLSGFRVRRQSFLLEYSIRRKWTHFLSPTHRRTASRNLSLSFPAKPSLGNHRTWDGGLFDMCENYTAVSPYFGDGSFDIFILLRLAAFVAEKFGRIPLPRVLAISLSLQIFIDRGGKACRGVAARGASSHSFYP